MLCTRMSNLDFLLFELTNLLVFEFCLCSLYNSNTLHNILILLGINVEQDAMKSHLQE